MALKDKKSLVLPYNLRVDIWNLIDKGKPTNEIVEETYCDAPPNVSKEQFKNCVRAIKAQYTKGSFPDKDIG